MKSKTSSFTPSSNAEYKLKSYWNERFEQEEEFDWLGTYEEIKTVILQCMKDKWKHEVKVLVLGCGNSTLSHDMYLDGFCNVLSMDYSEVVIHKMKNKYPHLEWIVMDVTDMKDLEECSFDIIIDKGVMDALVTDEKDPWNPDESVIKTTRKMCTEVFRLLSPNGGAFVQVSFSQPHFRRLYLAPETDSDEQTVTTLTTPKTISAQSNIFGWEFSWQHLPTVGFGYFVYTMVRNDAR
jgi:hypothetical protein